MINVSFFLTLFVAKQNILDFFNEFFNILAILPKMYTLYIPEQSMYFEKYFAFGLFSIDVINMPNLVKLSRNRFRNFLKIFLKYAKSLYIFCFEKFHIINGF